MTGFDVEVRTMLPADQWKYLYTLAHRNDTTVASLVREIVRRHLQPPEPRTPTEPHRRYLGEQYDAQISSMALDGATSAEISRVLGFAPGTVSRRRRELGLPCLPAGRPRKVPS